MNWRADEGWLQDSGDDGDRLLLSFLTRLVANDEKTIVRPVALMSTEQAGPIQSE